MGYWYTRPTYWIETLFGEMFENSKRPKDEPKIIHPNGYKSEQFKAWVEQNVQVCKCYNELRLAFMVPYTIGDELYNYRSHCP